VKFAKGEENKILMEVNKRERRGVLRKYGEEISFGGVIG
jgi:hypothetical protein